MRLKLRLQKIEGKRMKKKINYEWVIIALSFIMVFTTLGFCSSSRDLYLKPMSEALEMSRKTFALNDSCRYITTAVVNLFFGVIVGKLGTKKLIATGFLSLILSCILYTVANNVVVLCLGGCFLGAGLAWTTTTMVGNIVNKWCTKNKGTIMGAILASNGIGAVVATWIITFIKNGSTDPFVYRKAYMLTALILASVAAIILIFYKEPSHIADTSAESSKKGKVHKWEGIAWEDAVKKSYFWLLCICIFISGLVLQGVSGVRAAHLEDSGVNASHIATIISINMFLLTATKFSTGLIYDKFGIKVAMNTCLISSVGVMICFYFVSGSGLGLGAAYLYPLFSALALPIDTIMLPLFASDFFGEKSYNKFLGILVSLKDTGYAMGTVVVNGFYDAFGNYKLAFIVCGIAMISSFFIMQYVERTAKKLKQMC